jgi:hypothetical protein
MNYSTKIGLCQGGLYLIMCFFVRFFLKFQFMLVKNQLLCYNKVKYLVPNTIKGVIK